MVALNLRLAFSLPLFLGAASYAAAIQQNLTTYLLTQYADTYKTVITEPAFFGKVLNGTVTPEQVAYFFEQARLSAKTRASKARKS
jgi:hypothetical protein